MSLNPYKLRKWLGLTMMGIVPTLSFAISFYLFGIWYSIAFFLGGVLMSALITSLIIKTPFSDMLEGKGLLCLDINSTGVIRPFILQLNQPFVQAVFRGKLIKDVWDRASTFMLNKPVKVEKPVSNKDGKLTIELTENDYNKSKFSFISYPVLIYNQQIHTLITKEWLSEKENTSLVKHQLLYTNRILEDLNNSIRDFARYVVESLKPITGIFQSKWFWVIMAAGAIVLIILFGKPLLDVITQSFSPASSALGEVAKSADTVTIRG